MGRDARRAAATTKPATLPRVGLFASSRASTPPVAPERDTGQHRAAAAALGCLLAPRTPYGSVYGALAANAERSAFLAVGRCGVGFAVVGSRHERNPHDLVAVPVERLNVQSSVPA